MKNAKPFSTTLGRRPNMDCTPPERDEVKGRKINDMLIPSQKTSECHARAAFWPLGDTTCGRRHPSESTCNLVPCIFTK